MKTLFRQTWDGPAGRLTLEEIVAGVVRISMYGRADAARGRNLAMALGKLLAEPPRRHVFWDLWDLESYESEVRTASTQALMRNLQNVTSIDVLARSSLVRMGVAVANVALGGRIRSFDKRVPFDAALAAALASSPTLKSV